jgi:hypothetical protein
VNNTVATEVVISVVLRLYFGTIKSIGPIRISSQQTWNDLQRHVDGRRRNQQKNQDDWCDAKQKKKRGIRYL